MRRQAPLAAAFEDTAGSISVSLPQSVSAGFSTRINPQWDLMADVTWTGWHAFRELDIDFANPANPGLEQPENRDNTYKMSLGANYRSDDNRTWLAGIAYDQAPIPNTRARTPRLPDQDRRWLAAGFTYALSKAMSFDFAFAHLFIKDAPIDAVDAAFGHVLNGSYSSRVDAVAAEVNWQFQQSVEIV